MLRVSLHVAYQQPYVLLYLLTGLRARLLLVVHIHLEVMVVEPRCFG